MGAIDEMLPVALMDCIQIGLTLMGIIIVVGLVNVYLMIPTFIVGIIFYKIRVFYLSTSRSVKRLEGVTRSPVFAHLNASLQGLTTIRAFEAEQILSKEFDNHQDLHSSAWYLFISSSRAFGFWLDIVCLIYISVVTFSFLIMGSNTFGGNVGLAITQAIGLTGMFQWGMRQSAELENQMTSVERVLEYTNAPQEAALESPPEKKPSKDWPHKGQITFKNFYLRYSLDSPHVLKDLNIKIESMEKIGIVGRTGAGKSSLIGALFRLAVNEGSIFVDDLDINDLGLHELRSKLSIIPQEPVLFSGTMRKNLDPFDEYPDHALWNALDEVELKDAVEDLPGGLNSKMSEGGSNFSVGQRQLVCLARAIVRNNKVLVLDEATANVDPQTDALIQNTIRNKFRMCTVLTIAHRLNTVMDSDKVLVMDAGKMVEFDHPYNLLKNKDGFLYKMVDQTGKATADLLHSVAAESYRTQQLTRESPIKLIDEDVDDTSRNI
jgi:ATP-binding cassette subfamily C (CFTR/MRP) protein 4